ncbi:AAA family ATPase [Mycoplasmatota bacterium]|nr:AAA family ATPase [Mycoplasmatota bacterium]
MRKTDDILIANGNVDILLNNFDITLSGNPSYTTIIGRAGYGKSYLMSFHEDFFSNNAVFISSKCSKFGEMYIQIVGRLLGEVANHIYKMPKQDYDLVRKGIEERHTKDLEILALVSPYFTELITSLRKKREIITKHKREDVLDVVTRVFNTLSQYLFPLVIFVDDLQWADSTSITIFESIFKNENNIYLIFAIREEEIGEDHLSSPFFDEKNIIRLNCFSQDDTKEYLEKIFENKEFVDFDKIVNSLTSLTSGIPFYLQLVLNEYLDKRVISISDRVNFDLSKIENISFDESYQGLIIEKVERLSHDERYALNILSCCERDMRIDLLKEFGVKESAITSLLNQVLFSSKNETVNVSHDIIRYAVHDLMGVKTNQKLCLHILCSLPEDYQDESFKTFLILRADKLDLLDDDCSNIIEVIYNQAQIAKELADLDYAAELLELGIFLITNSHKNQKLLFDIRLDLMECEFIRINVSTSKKMYSDLLREYPDKVIDIKSRYISFYAFNAEWENVLELGKDILDNLNFKLRSKVSLIDLLNYMRFYTYRKVKNLSKLPLLKDKRMLSIINILTVMIPASNRIDIRLFNAISMKLAVLVVKYGISPFSAIGLSMGSLIQYFVLHNETKGNMIQKYTMKILNDNLLEQKRSIPYALLGTFTYHWSNSFSDTLDLLAKSNEYSHVDNEFLFSNYALVFSIITSYVKGDKLDSILEFINNFNRKKSRLEDYLLKHMFQLYIDHIHYLKTGEVVNSFSLDQRKSSFYDTIVLNYDMLRVHQLYITGNYKEAYNLSNRIDRLVWAHDGFILNGSFAFYSCLSRIAYHNLSADKKGNLRIIKKLMNYLKRWHDRDNINHQVRYRIASVEFERVINKRAGYEKEINSIIELVNGTSNYQLIATVNLVASRYYKYSQKLAELYLGDTKSAFKLWGADYVASIYDDGKVDEYEEKRTREVINQNVLESIKQYSRMSEQEIYNYYVDYIFQNTNVTRCIICIERNEYLHVKYSFNSDGYKVHNMVNINHFDDLPHRDLRFVLRTGLPVNISKFICLPLKQDEILGGVIYFECRDGYDYDFITDIVNGYLPVKESIKPTEMVEKVILTKREIEIIILASEGKSNKSISDKLFVTVGTVRNHLSSIYSKMGVSNRVQAIIVAKEMGLLK